MNSGGKSLGGFSAQFAPNHVRLMPGNGPVCGSFNYDSCMGGTGTLNRPNLVSCRPDACNNVYLDEFPTATKKPRYEGNGQGVRCGDMDFGTFLNHELGNRNENGGFFLNQRNQEFRIQNQKNVGFSQNQWSDWNESDVVMKTTSYNLKAVAQHGFTGKFDPQVMHASINNNAKAEIEAGGLGSLKEGSKPNENQRDWSSYEGVHDPVSWSSTKQSEMTSVIDEHSDMDISDTECEDMEVEGQNKNANVNSHAYPGQPNSHSESAKLERNDSMYISDFSVMKNQKYAGSICAKEKNENLRNPKMVEHLHTPFLIDNRSTTDVFVSIDHLDVGLEVDKNFSIQKESKRRLEEQQKMISSGKLCLVLDLDHTLLNSAMFQDVNPMHEKLLKEKYKRDLEKSHRHLFCLTQLRMWTKLRPGIWRFLEKVSELYELHIYTMGCNSYATEMARILDPSGSLFAGRIISKGQDSFAMPPESKDLEGVLGTESSIIIVDDTERVWPKHKRNLMVVERYNYFPCSRRKFGLTGPSLLDVNRDEREQNGMLASALKVLDEIHHAFFWKGPSFVLDVRDLLADTQQKVLMGCKIVFSRVFPMGEAQPHLYPLWRLAQQFGAVCTTQIDKEITHVVAVSPGTEKVRWGLSTGRHVVRPSWIEASVLLYRRMNEKDFFIC